MCKISLLEDSRTNTYLVLYGYIQGLYSTENYPEDGCKRCKKIALSFSQMAFGMGKVLNLFTELISSNSFANFSGTEQLTFLYDSYLIFWDFGINFDALLNDDSAVIQYRQFLGLTDPAYAGVLRTNFQVNLLMIMGLNANLDFPGKECKVSGVILGGLMRKIFGFEFFD